MPTTQPSCAEDARLPKAESEVEIPDDVADAWAAVLIDIYEKRHQRKEPEHAECGTAD